MSNELNTVYGKMAQVMQMIGKVDKDATHFQGYAYQSMEQVTTAIRSAMNEVNLIMLSECVATTDTGNEWLCEYRYTFVDPESGHSHTLAWQQSTLHTYIKNNETKHDDKAMGKNHTYAQKYFLMRTFLVSSKDDPDADTNDYSNSQRSNASSSNNYEPTAPDGTEDYTMAQTQVQTIATKKGGHMYIIGNASMFSTEPLEKLGYDVSGFDTVGNHELPDPVNVKWQQKGRYTNIIALQREFNGAKVVV